MASIVDICNIALSHLGDSATVASIDPPEGSAQAEHCARFYPVALSAALEAHPWRFALRRQSLALLSVPSWSWAYAYAAPADALRYLAVVPATAASDDEGQAYEAETSDGGAAVIYTDQDQACLRYIAFVSDPTRFSPLFTDAVTWLLASHLAGPVLKGDAGAAAASRCYQVYQQRLSAAAASDANQRKGSPTHAPSWIRGR